MKKGSTASRKRGVSKLMNAELSQSSTGVSQSHHGPRRARPVNAPPTARRQRSQKLTTPMRAVGIGISSEDAEIFQAAEPSSSNIRRVLSNRTSSGENGWAEM
jgi:hypothetical protein